MNINDFENYLDNKILQRGISYYFDGAVDEIWRESDGVYHAVVDGSEPYEVDFEIDTAGVIASHFCDCPYDWGEYCKHEVAVFLAVRELLKSAETLPTSRQKKERGLKALLENHTKEDLIILLCELSREYGLYEDIGLLRGGRRLLTTVYFIRHAQTAYVIGQMNHSVSRELLGKEQRENVSPRYEHNTIVLQ